MFPLKAGFSLFSLFLFVFALKLLKMPPGALVFPEQLFFSILNKLQLVFMLTHPEIQLKAKDLVLLEIRS